MSRISQVLSWIVLMVVFATTHLVNVPIVRADDGDFMKLPDSEIPSTGKARKKPKVIKLDPIDVVADPKNVYQSVYLVPRKFRTESLSPKERADIEEHRVESFEMRYNLLERREQGGVFFSVIHYVPNAPTVGTPIDEKGFLKPAAAIPSYKTDVLVARSYDDYQFSTGVLKKDFDKMWRNYLGGREAASYVAAGASIYAAFRFAQYLSVDKAAKEFLMKHSLTVIGDIASRANLSGVATKGLFDVLIIGGMAYTIGDNVYKGSKYLMNNVFFSRENMERDWLHRMITQAYERALCGKSIDTKQWDIDAARVEIDEMAKAAAEAEKSGKNGKDQEDQQAEAKSKKGGKDVQAKSDDPCRLADAKPEPEFISMSLKKDMVFVKGAFTRFQEKYSEPKADDVVPGKEDNTSLIPGWR